MFSKEKKKQRILFSPKRIPAHFHGRGKTNKVLWAGLMVWHKHNKLQIPDSFSITHICLWLTPQRHKAMEDTRAQNLPARSWTSASTGIQIEQTLKDEELLSLLMLLLDLPEV